MSDTDPSNLSWLGRLISGQGWGGSAPTPASGVPISIDSSVTAPAPVSIDNLGGTIPAAQPSAPPQSLGQQANSALTGPSTVDGWMMGAPVQAPPPPPPAQQAGAPPTLPAPPPPPTPAPQAPPPAPAAAPPATQTPPPPPPAQQAGAPPALPAQLPGIGPDAGAVAAPGNTAPPQSDAPAPATAQTATLAAKIQAMKDANAAAQTPATMTSQGSPLDAQWALTVPGESGGNAQAVNSTTGASGLAQFTPKTRDAFLASPAGKGLTVADYESDPAVQRQAFNWLTTQNQSTLAAAGLPTDPSALLTAHVLGAGGAMALLSNPDAPALASYGGKFGDNQAKTALITNNPAWGIQPSDTGSQAVQKITTYYQKAAGQNPIEPSLGSGPASPPQPNQPSNGPGIGPQDGGPLATVPSNLPGIGIPGYQPASDSQKMMALAAGEMGGKTLQEGFAQGLTNVNNLETQDRQEAVKAQQQQAQTAALMARIPLLQQQAAAIPYKLGQGDRKEQATVALAQDRNDLTAQGLAVKQQQAAAALALRQQQLALQQQRTDTYTQNATELNSGMRALGQKTAAESAQAVQGLTTDYASAGETMQKISDLQNLIGTEGITGSTFKEQFQRFAANTLGLDIGVTPSGYSITNKAMSDFNSGQALANGKGFGGRITQNEFKTLQTGVLSLGTDPTAAQAILGTYQAAAQRRMQIAENWQKMASSDPQAANAIMTNTAAGGLNGWYQSQLGGQFAARGISSDPNAPPTPSQYLKPQVGADGWSHVPASGSTPGIRFRINPPVDTPPSPATQPSN